MTDEPRPGVTSATNAEIYNLLSSVNEKLARHDERWRAMGGRFDKMEASITAVQMQLSEMSGLNRVTQEQVGKLDDFRIDHEGRLRLMEVRMEEVKVNRSELNLRTKQIDTLAAAVAMLEDKLTKRDEEHTSAISALREKMAYYAGGAAALGAIVGAVAPIAIKAWF